MRTADVNRISLKTWAVEKVLSAGVPSMVFLLGAASGLVLSVLSVLNICNTACTETAQYTIFGMSFGWFGVVFFSILLATIFLQRRFLWATEVVQLLVFAAAGAELRFLWLQKYVMEKWCPICLSIAATIYLMAVIILVNRAFILGSRRCSMKVYLKQVVMILTAIVLGSTGAVFGIKKEAEAAELNLFLGKTDSHTVVYFISDWFCPACRRTEPVLEKIYPQILKIAKVSFIDIPVHPETTNFTPYNTQFLVYEKAKYLQLRQALSKLAHDTKTPTPDDVQKAVARYGVKLRTMNYADIQAGMEWNESIFRTFQIKATPTVVVSNTKSGRHVNLVGEREITYPAILAAITNVEK